jgi:hypothetical protein
MQWLYDRLADPQDRRVAAGGLAGGLRLDGRGDADTFGVCRDPDCSQGDKKLTAAKAIADNPQHAAVLVVAIPSCMSTPE